MGCSSSTARSPEVSREAANVPGTVPVPVPTIAAPPLEPPSTTLSRSRSRSRAQSTHQTAHHSTERIEMIPRSRTRSAPQWAQPMVSASSQASQEPRIRANTLVGSAMGSRSSPRPPIPIPARTKAGARSLTSTMRQMLSDHRRFRILVVGKTGSGKSSLIDTVFKVNMPAVSGRPDINHEILPEDNRYLIIHESPGVGPSNGQNLQAIRDFISYRTDPNRSNAERLHAIWVCVPTFDAISGSVGEGVDEILGMGRAPVIVAFTKFDLVVAIEDGSSARANARRRIEQSCRSHFRREPRDVPAEIVSVKPQFGDLIDNLVMTTDRFIRGPRNASALSSQSSAQGAKPRIAPVPLLWSAALRVNREIFIQASIEIGRSRYWRGLWSSLDFVDQPLGDCVNVIHTDIVEIWNLKDRKKHLSEARFKGKMSHIVKDLAGLSDSVPSSDFAEWAHDVYRGSQENVRCVMGYIVNLTAILDDIFRTTSGDVSTNDVQSAVDRHVDSGLRDRIHRDIRNFVQETFAIRFKAQGDLVLEKIIELIRRYCVPISIGGWS